MPAGFPTGVGLLPIHRSLHRFLTQRSILSQTLTPTPTPTPRADMGSQGPPQRRPLCLRCSKPARVCLCARINSPPLDHPVAVTILQHSLEKSHPLNSIRVAKLGLRNLAIVPVTDVNFQAQLLIRPLDPKRDGSSASSSPIDRNRREKPDSQKAPDFPAAQFAPSDDSHRGVVNEATRAKCGNDDGCITAAFDKYSVICSPSDMRITVERSVKPNISWVLDSPICRAAVSNGFVVKKLQRKQLLGGSEEFQDFEEFEITMPPGSALLFPSNKSIRLEAVDFEVKNLIVLDGTWGKATRMYHENPWLQLLPHLRLETGKESLYSEVRHEPKAGCLSTIESIVCAMKGLGHDMEGLDNLLEVFSSMVEDQRRCKDEKFRAMSLS